MDHALTTGVHDSLHCDVQVWSIPLLIVFVVDFLSSAGLLGLTAMLDPIIFKIVLALVIFCAVGSLTTIVWSVAEHLIYRRYQGSKWLRDVLSDRWRRTMELLLFRVAIEIGHGILSLATFVWHGIVDMMGRLNELIERFLHRRGSRRTLLPTALNNSLRAVGAWVHWSALMHHDGEMGAVDLKVVETQVEEKVENAARFWHRSHNAEGVRLKVIKTHAHVGAIG